MSSPYNCPYFRHITINLCWGSRGKIDFILIFSHPLHLLIKDALAKKPALPTQIAGYNGETYRPRRKSEIGIMTSCYLGENCLNRCSVPAKTINLSHLAVAGAPTWAKQSEWILFQPLPKPSPVSKHSLKLSWKKGQRKFRKAQGCESSYSWFQPEPSASLMCWGWWPWRLTLNISFLVHAQTFLSLCFTCPGQDCSSPDDPCLAFPPDFNSCPLLPALVSFSLSCHWLLVSSTRESLLHLLLWRSD